MHLVEAAPMGTAVPSHITPEAHHWHGPQKHGEKMLLRPWASPGDQDKGGIAPS